MNEKSQDISDFFLDLPFGAKFEVEIKSASMSPLFLTGDSVFVERREFDRIKIGDIICFCQDFQKRLIVHRVIKKNYLKDGQNYELITRGDASIISDSNPVSKRNFVGLVISKIQTKSKTSHLKNYFFVLSQRLFLKHQLFRNLFY
ncbi:MAG: signal peptidase I [Patescibacteria group bacterium]|jgi:signal peptidase I